MNSPGHRENILDPRYNEIGFGVVVGNPAQADGAGATYTTEFGVIEGPDADADAVAAGPPPQRTAHPRAKKARRHGRSRGRRHGRKAHVSRRGGKGAKKQRRVRGRGPKAHISI